MNRRKHVPFIAAAMHVLISAGLADAGTVVQMDLPTLSDHAGQIVLATIDNVQSRWASNSRRIESIVTLRDVTYLKGALPDSKNRFALTVPGGVVDGLAMQVCCAPAFAPGQEWLLFLLPEYKTYPVVGLYQGAFLIQPDEHGVKRLAQTRHGSFFPVDGIDEDRRVRWAAPPKRAAQAVFREATGIHLVDVAEAETPDPTQPMTLEAFLAQLQPILDHSKVHALSGPAGKPVIVQRSAVPLVPAARNGPGSVQRPDHTTRAIPGSPRRLQAPPRRDGALAPEADK